MDCVLSVFFTAGRPVDSHLVSRGNRWRSDARPWRMVHRCTSLREEALRYRRSRLSVKKRVSLNRHRSRDVRVPNRLRSRGDAQRDRRHNQEQNTEQRHIELLARVIRNTSTASVAHLQIARAENMMADEASARKWFEDFLHLWTGADPDLKICRQAKTEYAQLRK